MHKIEWKLKIVRLLIIASAVVAIALSVITLGSASSVTWSVIAIVLAVTAITIAVAVNLGLADFATVLAISAIVLSLGELGWGAAMHYLGAILLSWLLGLAGLALLVIALRPLAKRFNEAVFARMDGFYLTPMKIKLGKGERVEMVALKSKVLAVWEPLLKRGVASLLVGIGAGLVLAIAVLFARVVLDLETFLSSESVSFAWWLIPVGVIATCLPVLLYTYYIGEWNRRHFRYIMLTGTTWVARVKAPEGTAYLSFGPSVLLEEAKIGSPNERVGEEAPTFLGRIWDGILWRWRRVAYIFLPTRVFGAADKWEGVEWAFGTLKILMFIAGQARERAGLTEAAMKAWQGARLEEAQAGEGLFFEAGKAAEILAAYTRLAPEGPEADLLLVEDPGLYDRRAWDIGVVAPVVARPAPPTTLAEFPEA